LDAEPRQVTIPRGVLVDLGATVKAWVADMAAEQAAGDTGCGVLVGIGGDIAVAGPAPAHGWAVTVGDDRVGTGSGRRATVSIRSGGVATSGITRRTWRRAGRQVHHIVDPRTGDVPELVWRTVSVAAASCADANTASTAAIVLGERAPEWLGERRLPARLVGVDGTVSVVAAWPSQEDE
jgi:thiamine biosynthesis lipoprotein